MAPLDYMQFFGLIILLMAANFPGTVGSQR